MHSLHLFLSQLHLSAHFLRAGCFHGNQVQSTRCTSVFGDLSGSHTHRCTLLFPYAREHITQPQGTELGLWVLGGFSWALLLNIWGPRSAYKDEYECESGKYYGMYYSRRD